MKVRLDISYRGAPFCGWQRQPRGVSVQGVLEQALSRLVGEAVTVVGASRTDAGVHARGQVAHTTLARTVPMGALVFGLNHLLPESLRVLRASPAAEPFHARYSAVDKEYRYRVSTAAVLSPLDADRVVRLRGAVDLPSMQAAAALLVGRHDFAALANAGGSGGSTVRTIHRLEWHQHGDTLTLQVVGDGFLRGMVRNLVGTLVAVGRGRTTPAEVAALVAPGGARRDAGPTMPAHGLELVRVSYPAAPPEPSADV